MLDSTCWFRADTGRRRTSACAISKALLIRFPQTVFAPLPPPASAVIRKWVTAECRSPHAIPPTDGLQLELPIIPACHEDTSARETDLALGSVHSHEEASSCGGGHRFGVSGVSHGTGPKPPVSTANLSERGSRPTLWKDQQDAKDAAHTNAKSHP
jgi:hypothetical protein